MKAPVLPIAPTTYERTHFDQVSRILTLYFTQANSNPIFNGTATSEATKNEALTVATLPTAASMAGLKAFVTDATATTFASIVAGGGANGVPVYSDGTNWRIG